MPHWGHGRFRGEHPLAGTFNNAEIHALHAAAFQTRLYDATEWDWVAQVERYSLGWVVARDGEKFVGFTNVLWDGLVHAFLEDVMVDDSARGGQTRTALSVDDLRRGE